MARPTRLRGYSAALTPPEQRGRGKSGQVWERGVQEVADDREHFRGVQEPISRGTGARERQRSPGHTPKRRARRLTGRFFFFFFFRLSPLEEARRL